MGYEAKKTEHSGPKRGRGAYWGYKWEAKKESSRTRRKNWQREIRDELARASTRATNSDAEQWPNGDRITIEQKLHEHLTEAGST